MLKLANPISLFGILRLSLSVNSLKKILDLYILLVLVFIKTVLVFKCYWSIYFGFFWLDFLGDTKNSVVASYLIFTFFWIVSCF